MLYVKEGTQRTTLGDGRTMDDEYDFHVENIEHTQGFGERRKRRKKKQKKKRPHEEAKDHFDDLAQCAEKAHQLLKAKNSPYRFCIYREQGEVFIDLVMLDEKDKIKTTMKRNITHQEFSEIIEHIETLDGLLVDYKA